MGYSPHIRVTPMAGAALDFNLDNISSIVTAKWFAEPVFDSYELITRKMAQNIPYGWRLSAILEFYVTASSLSETDPSAQRGLVELTYWLNKPNTAIAINFNAGGTPYRDCVLKSWSRSYAADKLFGAEYKMEFTCVDLLNEESLPPEVIQSPPNLLGWRGQAM